MHCNMSIELSQELTAYSLPCALSYRFCCVSLSLGLHTDNSWPLRAGPIYFRPSVSTRAPSSRLFYQHFFSRLNNHPSLSTSPLTACNAFLGPLERCYQTESHHQRRYPEKLRSRSARLDRNGSRLQTIPRLSRAHIPSFYHLDLKSLHARNPAGLEQPQHPLQLSAAVALAAGGTGEAIACVERHPRCLLFAHRESLPQERSFLTPSR